MGREDGWVGRWEMRTERKPENERSEQESMWEAKGSQGEPREAGWAQRGSRESGSLVGRGGAEAAGPRQEARGAHV